MFLRVAGCLRDRAGEFGICLVSRLRVALPVLRELRDTPGLDVCARRRTILRLDFGSIERRRRRCGLKQSPQRTSQPTVIGITIAGASGQSLLREAARAVRLPVAEVLTIGGRRKVPLVGVRPRRYWWQRNGFRFAAITFPAYAAAVRGFVVGLRAGLVRL